MNQEIQLSLNPSSGLPPQPSSWAAPVSTALVSVQQQPTPLATVHAHLRGRYVLTGIFAVVFGVLGGTAGYLVPHPGYQSIGRFEIDPVIITGNTLDQIMPMYTQYVNTVCTTMKSEQVLNEAMRNPAWKKVRPLPNDAYFGDWTKNLTVKPAPNSSVVEVTYVDDHKDGKIVAPIAVSSLITAYTKLYGDDGRNHTNKKIEVLRVQQQSLAQQISRDNNLIDQLLQSLGEEPQQVLVKKLDSHFILETRVRDLDSELRVERGELKLAEEKEKTQPYTVEDLARVDPAMQAMYGVRTQQEMETQELETRLGKLNPAAKAARSRLEIRNEQVNKYAQTLRQKYFIKMKADGTGGMLLSRDLSVKENLLKHLQELFSQESQMLEDLGRRSHQVQTLRIERARIEDDLIHVKRKIDELTIMEMMGQTFKVLDLSSQPSLASDKRIAFGALGFMFGGGLPVGLLLLASLMNPRFRYSDETTGKPIAGLTLLGILPDLPDRLSDPEQASIAAHCVHQIRTMLQISTGTEERHVFAVTSAAPGDGKTSLTLALGLSYAACGTRTLLIDCDLIGAGLTSRMNVTAADGVLEAIAHRSLLDYVRTTDIADVSILPVGNGQSLHASTLSPAALRRLIEEARKHFDTILIDTGPVLGSIEASLVAAAADAVVLTVSRGQQRPLVERTIEHLRHINATLAGVVFNRAQNSDFDRSISGLSLRSASAGHGHNAPRMGPVARAVQSAFKPAGEETEN